MVHGIQLVQFIHVESSWKIRNISFSQFKAKTETRKHFINTTRLSVPQEPFLISNFFFMDCLNQNGVMPRLRTLGILHCPNLMEPDGG